jgi:hypothetical protein
LISLLDGAGIPEHARIPYLSALSGRAVQTVSRWLNADPPGLPDLNSLIRLCVQLCCSADTLLGLTVPQPNAEVGTKMALAEPVADAGLAALTDMAQGFPGCEPLRICGDEMAPRLRDGDLAFVDVGVDALAGNGIYVIEIDRRVVVRRFENRIGTGLVFRCENRSYLECVVKDSAAAQRLGLRVVGRVVGAISAQRFVPG